jgi:acetyl esterase/lipase
MKISRFLFATIVLFTTNYATAQFCSDDDRFSNAEVFSSDQIDSLTNVVYGNAVNAKGVSQDLLIDYYFPNNSIDTMTERPFILLVHGGSFMTGSKDEHMTTMSIEFAKRGYVAATMSYRLGFDPNVPGDNAVAVYRAQQDANAAMRHTLENAKKLGIDTSWIFMGGGSAGAITALITAYGSQEEWNAFFPMAESKLGALDTSGNNLKNTFEIKGIFNNWGAVSPVVLNGQKLLPMISFHGELDQIVPIDQSPITGYGSRKLHDMLNEQGVCNDLNIDPTGKHVIYRDKEGTQLRAARAACFFKSLFCDSCSNFITKEMVPANCAE